MLLLNFYRMQQACLQDILTHEKEINTNFDYFIFFPENAFYFHPINITVSVEVLKRLGSPKVANSGPLLPGTDKPFCHVLTKDCLEWGGLNRHFQMMRRKEGVPIYASRLRYYRNLYESQHLPFNKESFEMSHLQSLKLEKCTISVDLIPVYSD